jgi:hypothetical protein
MLLFGYGKERNWTALFGYALFAGMLAVGYSYPGFAPFLLAAGGLGAERPFIPAVWVCMGNSAAVKLA